MNNIKNINVLDVIIRFVKAIKDTPKSKGKPYYYFDDSEDRVWDAKYLLGQILRLYKIDDKHILVSRRAQELWEEITYEKSIREFSYRNSIKAKVDKDVKIFIGASKNGKEAKLVKDKNFIWKDIFHDEHVIPITTIIDRLVALKEEELNYKNVKTILDDIVVCKMLKEENHVLNEKGFKIKRRQTVKQTIEEIYINECGIQIVGWKN